MSTLIPRGPKLALSCTLFVASAACAPPPDPEVFNDHASPSLASVQAFEALALSEHGRQGVKFILSNFPEDGARAAHYLESSFYALHDEWYWFRLVNGERIPGLTDVKPESGLAFPTIESIRTWARGQTTLPLDLRWVDGDRLYSPQFYDLALFLPGRRMGLGTLLRFAAVTGAQARTEQWVFMLEFADTPAPEDLARFFTTLDRTLPPGVSGAVKWLVRSTSQDQVAQRLVRDALPYRDRVVRFKALVVPGAVEVYNAGITAGRIRIVRAGDTGGGVGGTGDILFVEEVPDELPATSGLVSAVPQTPLAHLNLLARNRGIPNAFRAGATDDLEIAQLAQFHTPVLLKATSPDQLVVRPITEGQLHTFELLGGKSPIAVAPFDVAGLELAYDLETLALADADRLRPAIGGKAVGFLALLAAESFAPDRPFAISVKAYAEHLAPLTGKLMQLFGDAEFASSARARVLVLEGTEGFARRFPGDEARRFQENFIAVHPAEGVIGSLVRSGGVVNDLETRPIAPATLSALEAALKAQFAELSPKQGLRFRSSSNVEDIEGFNGAGLYESNTGFLDAAARTTASDRAKTVERAIRKTWASYWRVEAYEERRLERVDHLSGHMGVLVHPRFDDDKEVSNGVFVLTILPPGNELVATMELNAQVGAESVTNPTGDALPEVDRVTLRSDESVPRVERLRRSSRVAAGAVVLTDAKLGSLLTQGIAVARATLAAENVDRTAASARRMLALDFEFREVATGWPALLTGEQRPQRIVIKQARSLEPGLRRLTTALQALPFPRDVLARARRIDEYTCTSSDVVVVVTEANTDALAIPDLGHAVVPFTASVELQFRKDVPALGRVVGERVSLQHPALRVMHPGLAQGLAWAMDATVSGDQVTATRLTGVTVGAEGSWAVVGAGGRAEGKGMVCKRLILFTSAKEFLESIP